MVGETISHYRVLERLGGGGMGVVYRAEDTKLRRFVALKFLPPELTRDEDAKRRFVQEAQAASALDHPNICTVHEIDEGRDRQLFLAMTCYDGETLKNKIERGPLHIEEALDFAIQTTQGLVKAHSGGIVHRDIKPANLLVTSDGILKIVDFGLAKLVGQTGLTQTGTMLGTVPYMSPEQVRGAEVDARTDLWSLGVVLYEMVSGQQPFRGEHAIAMANAITQSVPPPLTSLRTGVPPQLERIVDRAMAKRREDRYKTAVDLLSELNGLKRELDRRREIPSAIPSARLRSNSRWWSRITPSLLLPLVVLLAAAAAAYVVVWDRDRESSLPRLDNPTQIVASIGVESQVSWSPDGRMLAYQSDQGGSGSGQTNVGNWDIWVTQAGGGPPANRTSDHRGNDQWPRWSPDSRQISFSSRRDGGGIFVMSPLAGGARKICPAAGLGPAPWSPDGSELACQTFEPATGTSDSGTRWLVRTTLSGETSRRHRLPGQTFNQKLDMSWSPDSRFVAYVDARDYSAQITRIWLLRLGDDRGIPITDGRMNDWSPSWSPDSRMLFFVSNRGGSKDLWRQRLAEDGTPDGAAERVTTGLELRDAAVSSDGRRLAYSKGRDVANVWRLPILADRPATWTDARQLTFDQALIEQVAISPDSERLMVSSDRAGNLDLWMMPAAGGELQQITTDPMPDLAPSWSPDGQSVAFYSARSGNREIWVQPLTGGAARQLTHGTQQSTYPAWSPDGSTIAFERDGLICTARATGGEPHCLATPDRRLAFFPAWSADGRSLAVQLGGGALARMPADGGPIAVLREAEAVGSSLPRWASDQQWIYAVAFNKGVRNVWGITRDGKTERQLTDLAGSQRGALQAIGFAADGRHLYITWRADVGDIWVADLIPGR